jgi:hypothetical protein
MNIVRAKIDLINGSERVVVVTMIIVYSITKSTDTNTRNTFSHPFIESKRNYPIFKKLLKHMKDNKST